MAKKPYAISAYETAQRATPPLQAVVLLYDGILKRIKLVAAAARSGDLQTQVDETMHAVRIIDGLNRSLDMEKGAQVAVGLRETYWAVAGTLYRAVGRPGAAEACDKLVEAMTVLRDAWAEIAGVPLLEGEGQREQSDAEAS